MIGGFLHVFELRAVFEHCDDEGGAHRVRRVTAIEPELASVLSDYAVYRVGVHMPAFVALLAVVFQRSN